MLASILIVVVTFDSVLSISILFYSFVFTANIEKFQFLLLLIFWIVFRCDFGAEIP